MVLPFGGRIRTFRLPLVLRIIIVINLKVRKFNEKK